MTSPTTASAEMNAVTEQAVENIQTIAAELLDKPVSFGAIIKVRLVLARWIMENGYSEALVRVLPVDDYCKSWHVKDADELAAVIRKKYLKSITTRLSQSDLLDAYHKRMGHAQETLLKSDQVKMSHDTLEIYRKGKMTLRMLYEVQPEALVGDLTSSFQVS